MKLTLTHTTTGWFESGEVAWFHHRAEEGATGVGFGAVCLSGDDHRSLGSPDAITITIEAADDDG